MYSLLLLFYFFNYYYYFNILSAAQYRLRTIELRHKQNNADFKTPRVNPQNQYLHKHNTYRHKHQTQCFQEVVHGLHSGYLRQGVRLTGYSCKTDKLSGRKQTDSNRHGETASQAGSKQRQTRRDSQPDRKQTDTERDRQPDRKQTDTETASQTGSRQTATDTEKQTAR